MRQDAVRERLEVKNDIEEQRIELEAEIARRIKELDQLNSDSETEFVSVDDSLNVSQAENEKLIKFFGKVFE